MTGDMHREDEDLEFEDDFGMENQADGLDDLFDDVEASPSDPARPERPGEQDAEEDALFQAAHQGSDVFGAAGGEFDEEEASDWPGQDLDAEEIGIPVGPADEEDATAFSHRDPLASDSEDFALDANEELELIQDDSELDAAAEDDAFVLEESDIGWDEPQAAESPDWDSEEQEAWAPPSEEEYEPAEEAHPASAAYRQGQVEAHHAQLEDYYDDASYADVAVEPEPEPVAKGPRRFGRVLRMVAGLAAAMLVLSAGTIVVLEPQLLGFKVEPKLVDRVQIARPVVQLGVEPPALPEVATDPVVTTDPVTTDPVTTDPVATDPVATDPVATDPVITDPVTTDPGTSGDPVTTDPVTTGPVATTEPFTGPKIVPIADPGTDPIEGPPATHVPVGETLSIGAYQEDRPSRVLPEIGIIPGSNAFAQLKNGNFFVGSVKSVAKEAVTLRIEDGEVTFAVEDLVKIAPLASAEYAELARAQKGFVRLTNKNRLVGSILERVADDHIILEMKSNRVLLPRSAIEEINNADRATIRFANAESDEEWVRRLVEEQMHDPANFPDQDQKKSRVRMRLPEKK